ncbi:MAG: hypothetical protein P0Y55_08255 [Candidatus Cohnella colombiensis]|uniref:Lipoprotein n=1 Tax=Candidatus Cohnella colombiensis TaxID=3121368 RepID=A0AA95F0I9_9BACL|nr:MAG: hypothetical protein P0Y55_08255 [Cohnella sp.]
MRSIHLILIIMVFIVAGCNQNTIPENNKVNEMTNEISKSEEPFEQNSVELDDNNIDEIDEDNNKASDGIETDDTPVDYDSGNNDDKNTDRNIVEMTSENILLVNKFFGVWTYIDEEDVFIELQDGIELMGIKEGDLWSHSKFSITEINTLEQFIVIHGYRIDMPYEDEYEEKEFYSKIYVKNDGNEILYINDYLDKKVESIWVK